MNSTSVRIYLSGSIKKGRFDPRSENEFWSSDDESEIAKMIKRKVIFLNPAKTAIQRNDYFVNYGCDLFLIQKSDVILVDLRTEKGIGVGAELMYAHFIGRPVVGWLPENSYYKRDFVEDVFGEDLVNWTHPFAFGLCDFISDGLPGACEYINRVCDGQIGKDDLKSPNMAIEAFKRVYGENIP
jgi:hypothetical protein